MKRNWFLSFFLILFLSNLYAQNPSWILAPKFTPQIGVINPQPLPTFGPINNNYWEGYKGQPATGSQNIIVDKTTNEIVFFMVDQYIYSKTGELIDVFIASTVDFYNVAVNGAQPEVVVVPVPGQCNQYYLISTSNPTSNSVDGSRGFYSKLSVDYDNQGNLLQGSGLEVIGTYSECNKGIHFADLIGPDFDAGQGASHDEAPNYAVVPKENSSDFFLFINNGAKIFRCTINENGIFYDNYFVDFNLIFPNRSFFDHQTQRVEMEAQRVAGGNYRLAMPIMNAEIVQANMGPFYSIVTVEFDPSGVLVANSGMICDYSMNPQELTSFLITGIEFSMNGKYLYATHTVNNSQPSTLDYFVLNTAYPSKVVFSTNPDYVFSQLESSFDDIIYIPTNNSLDVISSASNPSTITPDVVLLSNYLPTEPDANSGHLIRLLQDQIDWYDYSAIQSVVYDAGAYISDVDAVWEPNNIGNNPLIIGNGTDAYIRNELRIKEGTTLEIRGLNLHFSPGARVVIENGTTGQGAKLILNKTTFTNGPFCENDELWLGVEVWGNQDENQGSISNSTQGILLMDNSMIENAEIGVLLSSRKSTYQDTYDFTGDCLNTIVNEVTVETIHPFVFDDEKNGGIIQATGGVIINNVARTFVGNQRGFWARKYIAPSQANNLSYFRECNFEWDGLLLGNVNPEAHAQIESIKGIRFLGTIFANIQPDLFSITNQGVGILARQSQFYVGISCNTVQPPGSPCVNYDASSFKGLRYGMHVTNSDSRTYTVDRSNFINCVYGIFTKGTRYERITRNHFEVREADYNTAGCAIYGSTGYVIQENDLTEYDDAAILHGDGQSYGFVINNSGNSHNLIYKNTFQDLRVGGQSELTNGTIPLFNNVPEGLNWKCNEFYQDIYLADLGINGIIDPWQGELSSISVNDARSKAAGNTFSLYGENTAIYPYHDIMVYPGSFTQQIKYVHLADLDHTPDNVSPNITPMLSTFLGNPVYSDQNTCPSLLDQKPIVIKPKILQVQQALETEKEKLDGGNTAELLDLIAYESNENLVKNTLLDKSPFLTDEVLLAYLVSDAPSGMIKDVLIENSHLSDTVLLAVSNSSLPNGTKNQIMAVQSGESQRTLLYYTIHALNSEYKDLYNDLVSQYLNDGSAQALSELKDLLSQLGDLESKKLLLDVHVDEDELSQADQLKNQLMSVYNDADFYNLHDIKYDVRNTPAVDVALDDQPQLVYDLEYLSDFAFSEHISERAQSILELKFGKSEVPAFLPLFAGSAMMMYNDETNEESSDLQTHWQVVSMYPNPSSGIVTFDFPEAEAGDLLIQIISLDGKTMEELKAENTNGERMDLSHLKNGFYIVKISIDGVMLAPQKLEIHR